MRKINLMMSVSVNGFFEGRNGELDWHKVDDELHRHFNEQLAAMGSLLDGRVTYEVMAGFWPTADSDPSSTVPMAEFARIWRDMPKIVFSRALDGPTGIPRWSARSLPTRSSSSRPPLAGTWCSVAPTSPRPLCDST